MTEFVTVARRRLDNEQANIEYMTIEEQAIFYGELKGYAAEKGTYKPGWPAAKFRARFGDWPSRNVEATPTLDCTAETRAWIDATMRDFWRTQKRKVRR